MTYFNSSRPIAAGPDTLHPKTIPTNKFFTIIWAWNNSNSVTYHGNQRGNMKILMLPDGGCFQVSSKTFGFVPQWLHGVLFTFTWTYLALVEVYTGRYLKHWWRKRHLVHAIVGTVAGVLSLIGLLIIMDAMGWRLWWHNFHCGAAIISTFAGFVLIALGAAELYVLKKVTLEWQSKKLMWLLRSHKYLGYFLIFFV